MLEIHMTLIFFYYALCCPQLQHPENALAKWSEVQTSGILLTDAHNCTHSITVVNFGEDR